MNILPAARPQPMAPRVAIVHEWLEHYAGSERVLEQLVLMYPHAALFAIVDFMPPDRRAFLGGAISRDDVHTETSFFQKVFSILSWPDAHCRGTA